jgi:GNAT superfamily N-acetyltransferase
MYIRLASIEDAEIIWEILQQAIAQRKKEGSDQWQNGYPSEQTVKDDIQNSNGYVLVSDNKVIAYAAIIFGIEQSYIDIKGKWLSNEDCVVVHRVATEESYKGKGIATELFKLIESFCIQKNIFSIKVDTNFDNQPMLRILEKLNYSFCGDIFFSGASRLAFEKVLKPL